MIVMGARSSTVAAMTIAGVFAGAPAHAIQGGIATSAFGQVGTGHCCSAVQITANWVLTARHVGYTDQDTFSDAYGASPVAKVYHFSNAAFPENDLTLLRLAAPIAGAPALSLLADVIPYGELSSPTAYRR